MTRDDGLIRTPDGDLVPDTTTRTRDEIHAERCAELRRILRESRERRASDER